MASAGTPAAASSAPSGADPLELIRQAIASSSDPSNPLSAFTYLDQSGAQIDAITQAQSIAVKVPGAATGTTFDKAAPTRLARSKETLASRLSSGSPPSPAEEPELFFTVQSLLLAVFLRDERPGAYLAQAAAAGVASIPALDRTGVLEYLLSKRSDWAGVLPLPGSTQTTEQPLATTKRTYAPNRADIEFVKRLRTNYEVVLRTRSDALRGNAATFAGGASLSRVGSNKVTDFSSFRRTFAAKLEAARKASSGRASAQSSRIPAAPSTARKQRAQDPIIVISNSPTALLNMFNIKQYLEEGIFVPPEEARARARGVADLVVSITSRGGGPAGGTGGTGIGRRILVVDNAEAVNRLGGGAGIGASMDPWNRVVAVFTTGQAWQFKTYKWAEPRELFKHGES